MNRIVESVPVDRRIRKTKQGLRLALIKLIREKKFSSITITELANEADINRKTFYMHYSKIEDILKEIQDEFLEKLLLLIKEQEFSGKDIEIYDLFTGLNKIINENLDFYSQLVSLNSYKFLIQDVKDIFKHAIKEKIKDLEPEEPSDLYIEFIASGIIGMYVEWLQMESKISLEDLANAATKIVYHGMNRLITQK